MLRIALKILNIIEDHGFSAYIVGGFVRDYLLGLDSKDVDITTNATPRDIKTIFADACLPNDDYGSVKVIYKNIRFEITTYRRETTYQDNRRPDSITYVDDLLTDLKRRDFTINTICMDKQKKIIDPLHGIEDLHKKCIRTIGDPTERFSEDVLRILRAIRFATTLHFSLTTEIQEAILHTKYLLDHLSMNRKKEELDKIFASPNMLYGIELIQQLHLEEELQLSNIKKVTYCTQVIGVWTVLEVDNIYPFTRNERKLMTDIRYCLANNPLDPLILYQYGLYTSTVAGELLGIDKKMIAKAYQRLPIHSRRDLAITTPEIIAYLHVEAGPFLQGLYQELERKVLQREIPNKRNSLLKACKKIYEVVV